MGLRKIKRNLTKKSGNECIKNRMSKNFGISGIMCKCEKCGGLGYAEDETLLDSKGYLKDADCPCGGRIKIV